MSFKLFTVLLGLTAVLLFSILRFFKGDVKMFVKKTNYYLLGAMLSFARVDCSLVVTTRSRDVKVMTSKDAALLESVASALKEAMANRG